MSEPRALAELFSLLPQEVKDMILEFAGPEDPYILIGVNRQFHEHYLPRLYASAKLRPSKGTKKFIDCSNRQAWVHLISLRLFGPYVYKDDEESPLHTIYWQESYPLERFDALYMDPEDVLTMIHYMRPKMIHHHDQRGLLNEPIHRGTGTGNPPETMSGKNGVSVLPPCLTGHHQEYTPRKIFHYESWDFEGYSRPAWRNVFKPSGHHVKLHYICMLIGESHSRTGHLAEMVLCLVERLKPFLENWRLATVKLYFVDEFGDPQRMTAFRNVWSAFSMNGRLSFASCRRYTLPDIKEMVQLIMKTEGHVPNDDSTLDFLDFLLEYRTGIADPDSATA